MAVITTEGFDLYTTYTGTDDGVAARWTNDTGNGTVPSLVTGRFGVGQALRIPVILTTSYTPKLILPGTAGATLAGGFALRLSSVANYSVTGDELCRWFDSGGGLQLSLRVNSAGNIIAYRDSTVVLGSGDLSRRLFSNIWQYLEYEITINDTTGIFKVWIDGVLVLSLTSQDTKSTSTTDVAAFKLIAATNGSGSTLDVDDMYWTTASKLGEQRVSTKRPTADSSVVFTPSTGSNFQCVDETTINTTDYVSGSTVADKDLYAMGDVDSTMTAITSVAVIAVAKKTDAGTRELKAILKNSATTSSGGTTPIISTFTHIRGQFDLDPNGAAAWTTGGYNSSLGGMEITV